MTTVAFSDDGGFDFAVRCVLSGVRNRMADVGEVLTLCDRIAPGDATGWVAAWTALAVRARAIGDEASAAGRSESAWPAYLRSANYRFCGSYYLPATAVAEADPTLALTAWRAHRDAFDLAVDHLPNPVERLAVPFEGTTLPGYRFVAGPLDREVGDLGGARDSSIAVRPTVVMVNGIGTPMSDVFMTGVADALARGYHAVAFDGPGQGAALYEQGLTLRPDWDQVLGAVLDDVLSRPGTDPDRLAVMGISHGGWLAARALTVDHRPAAFVADPGVMRMIDAALPQLPDDLVAAFRAGDRAGFDRALDEVVGGAEPASNDLLVTIRTLGVPFGTASAFEALTALDRFDLGADVDGLSTPTLVCDPDAAGSWPGQSAELAAALGDRATLLPFSSDEGAGLDCEILAPELRNQRVFDWLDDRLA